MLQGKDSRRKAQRSLFVFYLHDKWSVFLLSTEINDHSSFYPMFQKGIFRRSKGRCHKKFLSGQAPSPTSVSPSSYTHSPVLCYAMVGLPAVILRGVTDFRMSVNSFAAVPYTRDNNNLVSIKRDFYGRHRLCWVFLLIPLQCYSFKSVIIICIQFS